MVEPITSVFGRWNQEVLLDILGYIASSGLVWITVDAVFKKGFKKTSMVFYICMQVNMIESVMCSFWVYTWEIFCRDTNVRFWSRIGAVPESKEEQEVSSIQPPALSPLIAVRERTHTDTDPRQGHISMAAKIISRMQSVWMFRCPLTPRYIYYVPGTTPSSE